MLKDLCLKTKEIVTETAQYIKEESTKFSKEHIESKGKHDYVTQVDKSSEEKLVSELAKILPEAGFIAEEGTSDKKGVKYNWIIDPIDGTTNFIHGAPPYSISIGLYDEAIKDVVLGVVYEIFSNECFFAYKGGGAFLNDHPIKVSNTKKLYDSLIATGFPYTNFSRLDSFLKTMTYLMENSHGVRRLGSAAIDLAYVACGRYDSFYEYDLKPWDVAAGVCLIKEAGGEITDFKGGDDYIFGKEIIASNGLTQKEFVEKVGSIMTS